MKKINKQAGFTLIELIMVIVILGVLASFALPRFADLGGEAREASINGAAGAIKAAANISHAQWLADGGTAVTVSLEGTSIAMLNGYPTKASIGTAAQITASDYTATLSADPGTSVLFEVIGTTNCSVSYDNDGLVTPIYTIVVNGC
jgi:MSHA pilin protein MshA